MIFIYPPRSTTEEKVPYDSKRSYDRCEPYLSSPSHGGKAVCSEDFIGLFLAFMRSEIIPDNISTKTTALLTEAADAVNDHVNGVNPPAKWVKFIECLGF